MTGCLEMVQINGQEEEEEESKMEEEEEEDNTNNHQFSLSHTLTIPTHTEYCECGTISPSSSQLAIGGGDALIRFSKNKILFCLFQF